MGAAGAAEAFPSFGKVFVSDALVSRDLTEDDITGPCMYTEVGGGLVVGGSATALLFGLDPKLLALSAALNASPAASHCCRHSQPATPAVGQRSGSDGGYEC